MARHLSRGAFFLSWWAMSFPTDVWAAACLAFYRGHPNDATRAIAVIALTAATLILAAVALMTGRAIVAGTAFREDGPAASSPQPEPHGVV